ncbi:MAG: alpha-amylase family protein [Anaerocolumna sp.]
MKKALCLPVCYFGVKNGALFGKKEFEAALTDRGIGLNQLIHWVERDRKEDFVVVIGTMEDQRIQVMFESNGIGMIRGPESTICQWIDTKKGKVLVLAGSDDVGLMYLLLEMARRIRTKGFLELSEVKNFTESPENEVRCMDRYLLGHLDNEWFLSGEFWEYYFARLARARFNRFSLIIGFDTAYMSPPYPFFLKVKGYEDVKVTSYSSIDIQINLNALKKMVDLCHKYGMKFVLATWQQRPWTTEQDRLVEGLPDSEQELSNYCYAGLKALLKAVPDIDIVQFRVNHESGVGTQISAEDFWNHCTDAIADAAKEIGKVMTLDLRAKGLMDSMIDHAYSRGLKVEVPTKYWCEHAALPYHLSVMRSEELAQLDNFNHSRRYSYADMLKKPKYYNVIFRLWNYGSTNLFLWGDADYARRFSKSCSLSGATGFQVNAPLSLKYGHELSHKEAWSTFADPALRSGKWEDERFWMWYTVFGRLGYRSDTSSDVWSDEFISHFGEKTGPVLEQALAAASKIVPLITTVHMPVHPSLRYWTEMNTGWALFAENNYINKIESYDYQKEISYGNTEPSEHGLFYGIDEYALEAGQGVLTGKYTPLQYSNWLLDLAKEVEDAIAPTKDLGEIHDPEYLAMLTDMTMLIELSRYHAQKILAALALAVWRISKEPGRLSDCVILLDKAVSHWSSLAELGLKAYYEDLNFGSAGSRTRRGTWQNLTRELEADQYTLAKLLKENQVEKRDTLSYVYLPDEELKIVSVLPDKVTAGKEIKIKVQSIGIHRPQTLPVLHYRHVDQTEGLFRKVTMQPEGASYTAIIPADYVTVEWDLMLYVTIQDTSGSCTMFPGIYHPEFPYPYQVVQVER